jgi:heme/copper-type cytochrome/quinol oxidase subunit 2
VITTLVWIGSGDFYTKGEPREASVAVSMIQDNEWVLPKVYADEFAYKPPLTHWLTAIFSLPQGKVTPFTSRLPAALAFIGLIVCSFLFFGQKLKTQQALLTCLILLTSFELHRAAMTSRVDMMLTFLIVCGLMELFYWEDQHDCRKIPWKVPLLLGLAALVKGPVGIVLPFLIFGIYLLFLKHKPLSILRRLLPLAAASLILPAIWYILAYQSGGKEFLDIVYAENFGRFFSSGQLNIQYDLGHQEPVWYNFVTLVAGFIPWTLLLVLSLFGLRFGKKGEGRKGEGRTEDGTKKIRLFSAIAAIVIVLFYCIPSSKRSVYLMPAYPFIAVFIAQYALYLLEYKKIIPRIFEWTIGVLGLIIAGLTCALAFGWLDPVAIAGQFTHHEKTLNDVAATVSNLSFNTLYFLLLIVLIVTLFIFGKSFWKKNQLKGFYAAITVYFGIFVVLDGIFLPAFKNGVSSRPYAEHLQKTYPINQDNMFIMNNLLEYDNMYSLNFFLNNRFHNFETESPGKGFLLIGKNGFEKVVEKYGENYQFQFLEEYRNPNRDGEKRIQFYSFMKK